MFVTVGPAEVDCDASSNLAVAGGEEATGRLIVCVSPAHPVLPGEVSSLLVLPRPRGARSGGGTMGIALFSRFSVIVRRAIFCSSVL